MPTVVTLEIPNLEELGKPLKEVTASLANKEAELAKLHAARQENVKAYSQVASEEKVKAYVEMEKKLKDYIAK